MSAEDKNPEQANVLTRFLRLIRFSHTVFALPFALGALLVAANGHPSLRISLLILACMVLARTAAMLFNRLCDWDLDQRNPRTAARHRLLKKPAAWTLLAISSTGFLLASAAINRTTGLLAPVALLIIFFYSLTKRFTSVTHFFLGIALAIAPAGAWIAQTGHLELPPLILGAGVICWVAGFDLIYATQDVDFDRREGLRSLVVRLGLAATLRVAQFLHLLMLIALIGFGIVAKLGTVYFALMVPIAATLIYEHRSARARRCYFDQSRLLQFECVCECGLSRCGVRRPHAVAAIPGRGFLVMQSLSHGRRARLQSGHIAFSIATRGSCRPPRSLSSTTSAQSPARDFLRSIVRRARARWRRCVDARVARFPNSSRVRNARHAPCSPPSLRRSPSRRKRFHGRTRLAQPLLLLAG